MLKMNMQQWGTVCLRCKFFFTSEIDPRILLKLFTEDWGFTEFCLDLYWQITYYNT